MSPQRAGGIEEVVSVGGLEMDYRGVVSHDNFVGIALVGGRVSTRLSWGRGERGLPHWLFLIGLGHSGHVDFPE